MKDAKIFVSYVNGHQKLAPTEKFNNQVDRMTLSGDSLAFLTDIRSLPNECVNKMAVVMKMEVTS